MNPVQPSALERKHPAIQKIKIYKLFSIFVDHFCPLGSSLGSGSNNTKLVRSVHRNCWLPTVPYLSKEFVNRLSFNLARFWEKNTLLSRLRSKFECGPYGTGTVQFGTGMFQSERDSTVCRFTVPLDFYVVSCIKLKKRQCIAKVGNVPIIAFRSALPA